MKYKNIFEKTILRIFMSIAFAFMVIMANTTCIGPGFQPQLPEGMERFKLR